MSSDELNLADPSPAPPPRPPALGLSPDTFKRIPKPPSDYAFPTPAVTFLLTIILTALGAYLRFWRLGQQAYWCDEAATAERVCDSFDHLVAALGTQAFPPGWYYLLQHWLHFMQFWTSSPSEAFKPENMRLLPAAFGALTVPAMYLLARQFTDRRGALLVTLLAAVNPFLVYYSRDIKMYSALYFFVTLHTGLFFWWLSVERWYLRNILLWPLVALSGVAMLSLHNIAWFIVGMELLWILTHRRLRAMTAPLWAASVGMMAILPIWWQLNKSNYLDRALNNIEGTPASGLRRLTGSADLGLGWIQRYTDMSWHTIIGLPTTHLAGFLWPEDPVTPRMKDWFDLGTTYHTLPWLEHTEWYVGVGLLTILFVGLLPWRAGVFSVALWRQRFNKSRTWKILQLAPLVLVAAAAILLKFQGLHAWPWLALAIALLLAPGIKRAPPSSFPKPAMRGRAWWIALWILIPVSLFAFTWMTDNEALEIHAYPASPLVSGMHIYATTTDGKTASILRAYSNNPSSIPAPATPPARTVSGILSAVAGNNITIADGATSTTLALTTSTTFIVNGASSANPVVPATPSGPATVRGTFTQLSGTQLTIQTPSGPDVLLTSGSTLLTISGRPNGGSAFLRPGMQILAVTVAPWHIPFTNWYLHHNTIWGSLQPTKVWEPRYLGIVVPAFLLWLAASLRRLPTLPLRAVAITAVVAVCTASALTNNLIYRQAPYGPTAQIVKDYMDPNKKDAIAYGTPAVEFAANSAQFPFILALGGKILPQYNANSYANFADYREVLPPPANIDDHILDAPGQVPPQLKYSPTAPLETSIQFLQRSGVKSQIQVIVLTDRVDGPEKDLLTDAQAQERLGKQWELKETVLNNWYYEWHFYIYHVWRTRVWVRKPVAR